MSNYSYSQLEGLWIQAGGSRAQAPIAAAIALAESGGNPLAAYPGTTVRPGQGSATDATGLWQILGPPAGFSASQLTDPLSNARMAVAKYKGAGNNFGPWVTYTTGAYRQFLRGGVSPTAPPPGVQQPGGGGTGGPGAGGNIASSLWGVLGGMFPFVANTPPPAGLSAFAGSTFSAIEDLTSVLAQATALLGQLMRGVEILFTPTFWVRAFCFLIAIPVGVSGLVTLARAHSGAMTALGMVSVAAAAVLLFVAFHNIPPNVTSPGTLAEWIKTELQGQTTLTAAPAPYQTASIMAPPLTAPGGPVSSPAGTVLP